MALNNFGLGFQLTANDLASAKLVSLGKNFGLLQKEADDTSKAFEGLTGRTRDLTTGRFAKSQKGIFDTGTLKEVGDKVTSIGHAMLGMGVAGLAVLGYASLKAAEFGKAIALVATEADLAIFPQEKMAEVAQKLAVQFGRLPVQEANALYKAVALGANNATSATQLMTGANLLAVAGNADLELTMNALGGALNAYGGDMSKATDFSDTLFTAMKNGNTTIQDLASSLGHITSAAANLNIPLTEIAGAVGVMTNKGVAAAEAVTGLKAALQSIVRPTSDASAEAARLGIKFTQAELRAKGLPGFLKEITESSKFTKESFSKLFEGEGANAIAQVAGDMGALNNMMAEMAKRSGATAAGFEIMSNTVDFQAQRFNALKDSALILIGDAIKPLIISIMKFGNTVLTAFTKLPKPLVAVMVGLFGVASAALVMFGGLLTGVGGILALVLAGKVVLIALAAVAGIMGVVAVAMAPLIAAGAFLYVMWTRDLGGIATRVQSWMHQIGLAFTILGDLLSSGRMSTAMWNELGESSKGLQGFVLSVYGWLSRLKHFFVSIGTGFSAMLKKAEPTFNLLDTSLRRLAAAFGQLFGGTNDPAANASKFDKFGEAGETVGKVLGTIIDYVTRGITFVTNFVTALVEGIVPYRSAFESIGTSISNIVGAMGQVVTEGLNLGAVLGLGDNGYGGKMDSLGISLKLVADALKAVEKAFAPVISAMQHAADLAEKLSQVKDFLQSGGRSSFGVTNDVSVAQHSASMGAGGGVLAGGILEGGKKQSGDGAWNASNAPGVAAAAGIGENTAAVTAAIGGRGAERAPIEVTSRTTLVVDGAVLAEAVTKHQNRGDARSFNPTPTPGA